MADQLQLSNVLSACLLSTYLSSHHRQWAAQQLSCSLSSLCASQNLNSMVNLVDLANEMALCLRGVLQAHQNRVTSCVYNADSSQLASW